MLADATPDYPMLCDIEVHCRGVVNVAALDEALAFATARNPLLGCVVNRIGNGFYWVPTRRRAPVQFIGMDEQPDVSYGALIDLFECSGLRVWVRQGEIEAKIILQHHHACSDALGVIQFAEDMMLGYAASFPDGLRIAPRMLDPARLKARGQTGLSGRSAWRKIADVAAMAREGAKFFSQMPASIARLAKPDGELPKGPALPMTVTCPDGMIPGLRKVANAHGVTVNDVLMRDLFVTLGRWNREHGTSGDQQRLRILMPQNIRAPEDAATPAANLMSFAFLTRRRTWCDDPMGLLQSLGKETERIRKYNLSLHFLTSLAAIQSAGAQSRLLRSSLCFATATLSNLGDPFRRFKTSFPRGSEGLMAGNLVVVGMTGIAPLRSHTHAAFVVADNGGTASIAFRADHHRYSTADARRLFSSYLAQLHETASLPPPPNLAR